MGNNRDTVIMAGAKVLENAESHHEPRASEISLAVLDVIEDAEKKQVKHLQVKSWFQGIKDLCYELIDVSEEFELVQQAKRLRFVGLPLLQQRKVTRIIREFETLIKEVGKLKLSSSSELPVPEAELEPVDSDVKIIHEAGKTGVARYLQVIGARLMSIGRTSELDSILEGDNAAALKKLKASAQEKDEKILKLRNELKAAKEKIKEVDSDVKIIHEAGKTGVARYLQVIGARLMSIGRTSELDSILEGDNAAALKKLKASAQEKDEKILKLRNELKAAKEKIKEGLFVCY
ncbi:hypothetical protein Ahy_B02g057514 [Arachis hypogaea]|uniref:Disease resistance N-terminal domain-containing protein n=1 Tax=Arachis hypogaea TaxID=3818 RepID=A0A445ACC2_ARAHY|nr:hypothetical protein Ahy_B02g057514 [Arachis hypogaea]